MGELQDKFSEEIKAAMKARDKARLETLRYVKKLFIENDTSGNPQPELDVVISYTKKVRGSLDSYPEGTPQREAVLAEINVLDEFLPKQLTEVQVQKIIDNIISTLDKPNMGLVMKSLTEQIKGQFDGKKASQMVQASLKPK